MGGTYVESGGPLSLVDVVLGGCGVAAIGKDGEDDLLCRHFARTRRGVQNGAQSARLLGGHRCKMNSIRRRQRNRCISATHNRICPQSRQGASSAQHTQPHPLEGRLSHTTARQHLCDRIQQLKIKNKTNRCLK